MNFEGRGIFVGGGSGGGSGPPPHPVGSDGKSAVTGDFPWYLDTTGTLVGDSGYKPSSFLATAGGSLSGNLNMQNHGLLNAQISNQYDIITPADSSPITLDVLTDIIYVDTSNFAANLTLAFPTVNKRITIRLLYQRGLSATIRTATNEVLVLNAATPQANLAYDGTQWFILSLNDTLGAVFPAGLATPTKLVPTGYTNPPMNSSAYIFCSASGRTLVAGGPNDAGGVGSCFVWQLNGTTWTQEDRLVGTGNVGNSAQGSYCAISADGNTIFSSGILDDTNIGKVWEFNRPGGPGTGWTQGNILTPTGSVGTVPYFFGLTVACSADGLILFVGTPNDNGTTGAVYVFIKTAGIWVQVQKLLGTGTGSDGGFGSYLVCNPDASLLVVGAPYHNTNVGAWCLFTSADRTTWAQQGTPVAYPGTLPNSFIGGVMGLADSANQIVMGNQNNISVDHNGFLQVYGLQNAIASYQNNLQGLPTANANQGITNVITSSDGTVMISGGYADSSFIGCAYLWIRRGANWQQYAQLTPPSHLGATARFSYGSAMSSDGSIIAILAPADNSGVGAVWVYV